MLLLRLSRLVLDQPADDQSRRDAENAVLPRLAVAQRALTGRAVLGGQLAVVKESAQAVGAVVHHQDHVPALPAVAPVRAALGPEFSAVKMHDAIAALAGAGEHFDMIDKHRRSIGRTGGASMRLREPCRHLPLNCPTDRLASPSCPNFSASSSGSASPPSARRRSRSPRLHRGETINALWLVVAGLCTFAVSLPLLQQVAGDQGAGARRAARATPSVTQQRRQGFRADEQVGRLRPSLRGHRRAGAAGRAGAGGAVRLSAGHAVDSDRRHARRRRA